MGFILFFYYFLRYTFKGPVMKHSMMDGIFTSVMYTGYCISRIFSQLSSSNITGCSGEWHQREDHSVLRNPLEKRKRCTVVWACGG